MPNVHLHFECLKGELELLKEEPDVSGKAEAGSSNPAIKPEPRAEGGAP